MSLSCLRLKHLSLLVGLAGLAGMQPARATVVVVELSAPLEVGLGESKVIADYGTVIPNLVTPVIAASNHPNEGAWSARLTDSGSSGSGPDQKNKYIQRPIGSDTNALRRFEAGEVLDIHAPAVYELGAKSLWTLYRADNEWTAENPKGIAGILLADEFGNFYPAFVEVEVDPSNNGTMTISRYGYSTIANQNIVIPIPEPALVMLVGMGVTTGLILRRRQDR